MMQGNCVVIIVGIILHTASAVAAVNHGVMVGEGRQRIGDFAVCRAETVQLHAFAQIQAVPAYWSTSSNRVSQSGMYKVLRVPLPR
jgi:hypothetical protein